MAKKFLIFTSVFTVIFSILALIVTPFAVEDLAITASDYYEKVKGMYDEEFVNSSDGITTVYLKDQYNNLTVKKSNSNEIKIHYTNNTTSSLEVMASKIDETLTVRTTYTNNGFNWLRRENVLHGIMNWFYYDDGLMTEIHVPEGVEIVLPQEPWGMIYVDDGIKVTIKDDSNNSNNFVSSSEIPANSMTESGSVPTAPVVIDAVYIQDVKNKLENIDIVVSGTYNDFQGKKITEETLYSGLENLRISETDLLRSFFPNDANMAEQYVSDANQYANIVININVLKIKADNLLEEYTAGTIEKPEYYERDLQLYNQKSELENNKKQFANLETQLKDIEIQHNIKFPFAKIIK